MPRLPDGWMYVQTANECPLRVLSVLDSHITQTSLIQDDAVRRVSGLCHTNYEICKHTWAYIAKICACILQSNTSFSYADHLIIHTWPIRRIILNSHNSVSPCLLSATYVEAMPPGSILAATLPSWATIVYLFS